MTCHAALVAPRCLLVDDNGMFLEAARALLEREGLAVAGVATTGAEALAQAQALQPDVVLVDVFLADENGFDVARRLVDHDLAGGMCVILISTRAEADLSDLLANSPADGFLAKSELSAQAILRFLDHPEGDVPPHERLLMLF
jgi:two-component system, NarL family, nitrate/nitrite response regulator NarL